MSINTLFFDLDNTLYPLSNGLWALIRQRIDLYMHDFLGYEWDVIPDIRRTLYENYGTTLRGLQITQDVNTDEFLTFVHDVPIEERVQPDPASRQVLDSLPYRKIIFTNSDQRHARRVLRTLEMESCFEMIIDINQIAPNCKPQPEAFLTALEIAQEKDPRTCVFIDDSYSNLKTAAEIGFITILMGDEPIPSPATQVIHTMSDLPLALRAIENQGGIV